MIFLWYFLGKYNQHQNTFSRFKSQFKNLQLVQKLIINFNKQLIKLKDKYFFARISTKYYLNSIFTSFCMPLPSIWDFLIGGFAGIVSKTLVAPFERVRLLLQTQAQNKKLTQKYHSVLDCLKRISKQQGIINFWKSNLINIIRFSGTQSFTFTFKQSINKTLITYGVFKNKNKQLLRNILAGGLAGSLSSMIMYPLDYSRTRIAVDLGKKVNERQFNGLKDCVKKTIQFNGVKGLYAGWQVGIIVLFVYRGLYFGIYDTGKQKLSDTITKFCWAQFSVLCAQLIAYPGDTVKRKMMMQSIENNIKYRNAIDCILTVRKKYGILSLWNGFNANFITMIGTSLCLVLYDEIKEHFNLNTHENYEK